MRSIKVWKHVFENNLVSKTFYRKKYSQTEKDLKFECLLLFITPLQTVAAELCAAMQFASATSIHGGLDDTDIEHKSCINFWGAVVDSNKKVEMGIAILMDSNVGRVVKGCHSLVMPEGMI